MMAMFRRILACLLLLQILIPIIYSRAINTGKPGHPVILVPGHAGSDLQAKLDKPSTKHFWCWRSTNDYYKLWLNVWQLLPFAASCFADNFRMVYDSENHTVTNAPGVEIKVPGFGTTQSVEYLDHNIPFLPTHGAFPEIIDALLKRGYTRDVNIRGAPYDFRKSPNVASVYLMNLTQLIEETYTQNGNATVVVIAYSMGNLYIQYLLQNKTQAWKDKYIKSWVAMAAPWGGLARIFTTLVSGDDMGASSFVNELRMRSMTRTIPVYYWLMPNNTFWNPDEVLISQPGRNYTVNDYEQLLEDLEIKDGWKMRQDTESLLKDFKPPHVEVHCLNGEGFPTPERYEYKEGQWPDAQPSTIYGKGDGTISERSLIGCTKWTTKQSQQVIHKMYNNTNHRDILKHPNVISYIEQVVYDEIPPNN